MPYFETIGNRDSRYMLNLCTVAGQALGEKGAIMLDKDFQESAEIGLTRPPVIAMPICVCKISLCMKKSWSFQQCWQLMWTLTPALSEPVTSISCHYPSLQHLNTGSSAADHADCRISVCAKLSLEALHRVAASSSSWCLDFNSSDGTLDLSTFCFRVYQRSCMPTFITEL